MSLLAPSECLALLAVFTDVCKEVDLLANISQHNFPNQEEDCAAQRVAPSNPDTLLTELNKIFFQTLLRYEKARSEDYLELPDGTFRKLNEEESTNVRYVEIVSRVSATLKTLLLELEQTGTIQSLEKYCFAEQTELDKLETFVSSASEKEERLIMLQDELQKLQIEMENEEQLYSQTLERLKHEFQELRDMSNMTLAYKAKEYATKMQHDHLGEVKELNEATNKIEHVKSIIAQASRCEETACSWLYFDIAKKRTLTEFVPTNDRSKVVAKELDETRVTLREAKDRHAELQKQYDYCENLVAKDKLQKESIRVREEYVKRYLLAVLQIQCWWRTMIEVRGIRKKRRKKGGKGGKGKKK